MRKSLQQPVCHMLELTLEQDHTISYCAVCETVSRLPSDTRVARCRRGVRIAAHLPAWESRLAVAVSWLTDFPVALSSVWQLYLQVYSLTSATLRAAYVVCRNRAVILHSYTGQRRRFGFFFAPAVTVVSDHEGPRQYCGYVCSQQRRLKGWNGEKWQTNMMGGFRRGRDF